MRRKRRGCASQPSLDDPDVAVGAKLLAMRTLADRPLLLTRQTPRKTTGMAVSDNELG